MKDKIPMVCEECHVGRYHAQNVPYLAWLGQHMMVVSDAAAYVCDVCHHTYYDPRFIRNIDYCIEQVEALPAGFKPWLLHDDNYNWQSIKPTST